MLAWGGVATHLVIFAAETSYVLVCISKVDLVARLQEHIHNTHTRVQTPSCMRGRVCVWP
jgi:hypothetical protein